ncbi:MULTISPECIES: LysM peptidoglycan-binding domain-containing protein [Brevibacillus]|uniref:LysM peptidoglycan-binding domain-containing protein n=1 Tax=Brevibacillus porteri TaxID=2126350 RepID=A0ABX5FW46_9BACL|nr:MULTISPECIES: LysM peptidoglycan-binding domain-containing protein [Brevibacillus]ATF13996.1 peptidoglycan-binding protein LysM [Brevibacillus brevis X23]MDC0759068.1 LysM peptidoglycan-binding domain-containing protein [Brevibacillus sp. AG]MED1798550.1 LysM peptidoglycan-binding domain-containing protein [Brevibacillus porteri]MED2131233.1 LysM peptidoglycan-binding domain-containing protein [Brevibacillus porteri]MED2743789.1 LysM peptidoglycan-binding domain-containing protein [Brevibac
MNSLTVRNRFEKKEERRVRFGITRGQALLFLITFTLFFYLLTELVFASSPMEEPQGIEVTVQSGDSLWSLAVQYNTDQMDVRDYIIEIKDANGLESNRIYPGQTLILPDTP